MLFFDHGSSGRGVTVRHWPRRVPAPVLARRAGSTELRISTLREEKRNRSRACGFLRYFFPLVL